MLLTKLSHRKEEYQRWEQGRLPGRDMDTQSKHSEVGLGKLSPSEAESGKQRGGPQEGLPQVKQQVFTGKVCVQHLQVQVVPIDRVGNWHKLKYRKFQEIRKYFYCEGGQTLEETQEERLSFEIFKIQIDMVLGNLTKNHGSC